MIAAQSANWTTLAAEPGRHLRLNTYVEGVADVLCTEEPPDKKAKTQSLDLDGFNDDVNCGTGTGLAQLADWTVCAWLKLDALPGAGSPVGIIEAWTAVTSKGWGASIDNNGRVRAFYTGSGGAKDLSTTTVLSTNTWTYVAVSLGGNSKTVLRGIIGSTEIVAQYFAVTRAVRNDWTAGVTTYLGRSTLGVGAAYLNGHVGYVAVFDRALTHEEMRRVKYRILDKSWGNDDSAGLWDDLVAQYTLERGSGTSCVNSRAPGTHDGTIEGGGLWAADAPFTITYRPYLSAEASFGQDIEPLGTKTSISGATLKILDTDEWFTSAIKAANLDWKLLRKGVRVHLGMAGLLEEEYQPVFIGAVKGFGYEDRAYSLSLGDPLFQTKVRQQLAKGEVEIAMTAASTSCPVTNLSYWLNAEDLGLTGYVRSGDEIMGFVDDWWIAASSFRLGGDAVALTRGEFGTTAAAHALGDPATELWVIDNLHPLTIALRLLLSDAGFAGSSVYDFYSEFTWDSAGTRFTRRRGLGLSPSDVAVAEIESLRDNKFAGYLFRLHVEEPIDDVKEFVERELLRPIGCYLFTKSDGRLSVASHKVPVAGDVVDEVDPSNCSRPRWEISHGDVVNYLQVDYDWNPGTQKYEGQYFASDATSVGDYGIRKRELETKGIDGAYTPTTWLDNLKTDIFKRFAEPYLTVEVTCGLDLLVLEIADAVLFTHMELPNNSSGLRGVHLQLWQIVGRTFDMLTGRTRLTLADMSRA